MELSEAKEAFRNRIECEKITLEKLSKETPKGLLEYEKRQRIFEIDDTVLKALDNSINKDNIRKKMEELEKIRDGFLSERKGCIFNTEKINCCTFARNILFDLIEERLYE